MREWFPFCTARFSKANIVETEMFRWILSHFSYKLAPQLWVRRSIPNDPAPGTKLGTMVEITQRHEINANLRRASLQNGAE
jgi:hypothetical protein